MLFFRPGTTTKRRTPLRLQLETLESRTVPSGLLPAHHVLAVSQADPHATYHTIQSAVNAAQPGDEIRIYGGTYKEAVAVTTPGLTLDGAPGASVVIENPGGADNGISVAGAPGLPLKGFTLANVTVRDFSANGVFLIAVKDFVISHVRAEGNAGYGLYPVLSTNGLIEYSVTTGSNDSGIYVGQSANVIIRGNTAYDNVNGIEVENSSNVQTTHNVVYNNTVGILVDLLPAALVAIPGYTPIEASTYNLVADNVVFGNNRANTASPDDIAAVEPPGTGIAVVGGDHTTVRNNVVVGNAFAGIALLSGTDLLALAPGTPGYSPGVDANPNDTLITGNIVLRNGFFTGPVPPGFPAPADLVWTLSGKHNHWRDNLFGTSSPNTLP